MYRRIFTLFVLIIFVYIANNSVPKYRTGSKEISSKKSKARNLQHEPEFEEIIHQISVIHPNDKQTRLPNFLHRAAQFGEGNVKPLDLFDIGVKTSKHVFAPSVRNYSNDAFKRRRLLSYDDRLGEVNNISTIVKTNLYRFPSDIQDLCPYADFCSLNATIEVMPGASCCQSCYCDQNCEMRGDCCFKEDSHKDDMVNKTVCVQPLVLNTNDSSVKAPRYKPYRMIDRCLDSTQDTCKDKQSAPWGAFFPVYSSKTGNIYFNKYCALCNDDTYFQEWNAYMSCDSLIADGHFRTDIVPNAIACPIAFGPPHKNVSYKHECLEITVTKCNETGKWNIYDYDIEMACEKFWAPVFGKSKNIYKNIYCLLCNGREGDYVPFCEPYKVIGKGVSDDLTFLLDWNAILEKDEQRHLHEHGNRCPRNTVKHPYKNECRALLCPVGLMMMSSGCQPFSKAWYKSGYILGVELSLVPGEDLIPATAFDTLTLQQRKKPKLWINAGGLPLNNFGLYRMASGRKNHSFVEKMIIRLGGNDFPLNIEKIFARVTNALSQTWTMKLNGQTYRLFAKHSKYGLIIPLKKDERIETYETLIIPSKHRKAIGYVFTKMNFCSHVTLYGDEFIFDPELLEVRLNFTGNGFEKRLSAGEIIQEDNSLNPNYVKICVEDFSKEHDMTNGVSTLIYESLFVTVCGLLFKVS